MRRSKSDWLFLFEDQKNSGMNIKDYCFANEICPGTFYNARHRYRDCLNGPAPAISVSAESPEASLAAAPAADTAAPAESVDFIQIRVEDPEMTPVKTGFISPASPSERSGPPGTGGDPGLLDFMCNGVRRTMPATVSDSALFRIMKV